MEMQMKINSAHARTEERSPRLQYVVVNHRTPRADPHCSLCGGELQQGYVRDLLTDQLYCDRYCLAGHAKITARASHYLIKQAS
jgi:hypothetical protein